MCPPISDVKANDDRFALMMVKEASTELQFSFFCRKRAVWLREVHILHAGIKWNPIFITYIFYYYTLIYKMQQNFK